jgi:sugar O-acyltransferase (sialic acid O-acetyltransferase NeuD family)
MNVVVVGAGGHGHVVADILVAGQRQGQPGRAMGFVDDRPDSRYAHRPGQPFLGTIDQLSAVSHDAVVVAIGDNDTRARVMCALAARGETFVTARHPSAVVSEDVEIGDGSMVCAGALVVTGSRIGRGVILNTGSTVDHHCTVGDYVHIAPGVHLGGEVSIGDRVLIGIGAVVLPRISIGAGAIVGGGAVVTGDVPPGVTVVGVPARPIRERTHREPAARSC